MRDSQTCDHCDREIPISAWICPRCGSWVGEVFRVEAVLPQLEPAAA